ncbi:hypothetical protein BpHYR1_026195 [Brachionus plicatilis]|uniref:Uncharacterized protein n=1 Tax=Brachionus plicatilis TaxID=10195 RepID=A0A3M7SQA5_BRAPC|nr:hypothetical protein BpHYR1_026195 [Brachionus plicatilis]
MSINSSLRESLINGFNIILFTKNIGFVKFNTKEQNKSKINSVNAEWCNIESCINCKSLLMMCKISAKCTTPDYIEI